MTKASAINLKRQSHQNIHFIETSIKLWDIQCMYDCPFNLAELYELSELAGGRTKIMK